MLTRLDVRYISAEEDKKWKTLAEFDIEEWTIVRECKVRSDLIGSD